MPHYKSPNDSRPHWLSDEDVANGCEAMLPVGSVEITDADADMLRAPTPEQVKAARITDIDMELIEIDAKGARPSREITAALAAGSQPPAAAVQKLADLEAQAESLRSERRSLTT